MQFATKMTPHGATLSYQSMTIDLNPLDVKDKVMVAIVKALLISGNIPSTPRELSQTIQKKKFTTLGGHTPYATIASRISQHFKRSKTMEGFGIPLLGKKWVDAKKYHYFIDQPGVPVGNASPLRQPKISDSSVPSLDLESDKLSDKSDTEKDACWVPEVYSSPDLLPQMTHFFDPIATAETMATCTVTHKSLPALQVNTGKTDFDYLQLTPVSPLHQSLELEDEQGIVDMLEVQDEVVFPMSVNLPSTPLELDAPEETEFATMNASAMDEFVDFGRAQDETKEIHGENKFFDWFKEPTVLYEIKAAEQMPDARPVYCTQIDSQWFYVCWALPVTRESIKRRTNRRNRTPFSIGRFATAKATIPDLVASLKIESDNIPLLRQVNGNHVCADTLLHSGGVIDEQDKGVILSLERNRVRSNEANWIPLSRAQALAVTLSINALDLFLSDKLSLTMFDIGKDVNDTEDVFIPTRSRQKSNRKSIVLQHDPTLFMCGQDPVTALLGITEMI
ncbi:hypothetical protein EDD86DRAFT_87702 [Gorgonomyces haynaldii]|nr:hypothetical protein EDD86DRAFT_87702 [Gorgonomyces haynaldii]